MKLGGNGRLEALDDFVNILYVFNFIVYMLFEELDCLFKGLFVSRDNLNGVETHLKESFSLVKELTSEGNNEVGGITAFVFLHFGGQNNELSSGMLNFQLKNILERNAGRDTVPLS